jgi:hypothetical protein
MSFDNSYVLFPIQEDEKEQQLNRQVNQDYDIENEDSISSSSSCYFLTFISKCLRIICESC